MGNIAIDDLSYNDGACPVSNNCDFEASDNCGYVNDFGSFFQWRKIRSNASDPDHSYGTDIGNYMLASSVSPHLKDKTARLLSPVYPSATVCVSFWYKTLGDIQFNLRTYSFGAYSAKSYFVSNTDRGKEWSIGRATISITSAFQIVFEAVDKGPTFRDGFAYLDDVEINYKSCQPLGSCNFEEGFCGFGNALNSEIDWIILMGTAGLGQNVSNVPTVDNTLGSAQGSFLYLDTNSNQAGTRALLESEVIADRLNNQQCLQFYIKTQNNVATLNINRKNKLDGLTTNLFTFNGYNSDFWIMKEVQLVDAATTTAPNNNYPYSFVIEGVVGSSKGQLAVDDVKLYNGTCNAPVVVPTQFDCQNGQVIDISLVCDFKNDCTNGFDEKNCGNCDFENDDLCGWTDKSTGSNKWYRVRNGSLSAGTGPSFDHTYNNQSGKLK
jgi:hypothetical protein